MNIFFLHRHPSTCAQYHCDKHVVKMILETCQLLCTFWHCLDPDHEIYTPPYKKTHLNHPCAKWVRESKKNYIWLCVLGKELCIEYTFRYGKIHKCQKILNELSSLYDVLPKNLSKDWIDPPQAMPEEYKSVDSVHAYRYYYKFDKSHLHSWKFREIPKFILE